MDKSQYNRDLNKFADPLTTDARYWVGFLMADGNLGQVSNNGRTTLSLGLASRDEGHVRKFAEFLGAKDQSVKEYSNSRGYNKNGRLTYVSVSIKESTGQLMKYGVVPNKSLIASPPESLLMDLDFWRGVVDGDGTVSLTSVPWISVCGTNAMVSAFADYAAIISGRRPAICRVKSIFKATINGRRAQKIISTIYYDDCQPYLDRKMEIAQKCKDWRAKTLTGYCNRGHALAPENTYVYPDGRKQCRTCRTIYKKSMFLSKGEFFEQAHY